MRSFTAKYAQPHTRDEANHFCAWVRRAISSSHCLHILRLIGDNVNLKSKPSVSFDGLINHMTARHFRTLRVLDLGTAFIGGDAFKELCATCTVLEDLTAGVGWSTAVISHHVLGLLSVRRLLILILSAGLRHRGLRVCSTLPSYRFFQHQECQTSQSQPEYTAGGRHDNARPAAAATISYQRCAVGGNSYTLSFFVYHFMPS